MEPLIPSDELALGVLALVVLCLGCVLVPAVAALSDRWQLRRLDAASRAEVEAALRVDQALVAGRRTSDERRSA